MQGNAERLRKVADIIEANPEHFDMQFWVAQDGRIEYCSNRQATRLAMETNIVSCGTTACLAGWAVHLWGAEADPDRCIIANGASILGLSDDDATRLFMSGNHNCRTAADAAEHLRNLAAECEV